MKSEEPKHPALSGPEPRLEDLHRSAAALSLWRWSVLKLARMRSALGAAKAAVFGIKSGAPRRPPIDSADLALEGRAHEAHEESDVGKEQDRLDAGDTLEPQRDDLEARPELLVATLRQRWNL